MATRASKSTEIGTKEVNHGKSAVGKRRSDVGEFQFSTGGSMKESKAMEMRHAAAMKKAGVPKKIVKEEMAAAASMKKGGKMPKFAKGGGIESKGRTKGKMIVMKSGGKC